MGYIMLDILINEFLMILYIYMFVKAYRPLHSYMLTVIDFVVACQGACRLLYNEK